MIITVILVMMATYFSAQIYRERCASSIMYAQYDLDTVTATDFTIEMKIPSLAYLKFCEDKP